jgi:arylsulfatase A-like enzyme
MTGRYPMRHGLQTVVIFPAHAYGLPTDERTLPQALKEAVYTTAMVGKWHLGHADREYWPQSRGFDHFYGNLVGEVDRFTKERGGVVDWQRNGEFLREDGYHTTLTGDEAVRLIEAQDPAKPLFLYFAALAVHAPLQATQPDLDAYAGVFEDEEKRVYAAMLTSFDTQVGRIVEALEKRGMRENTLIFFSADNGGVRKMRGHAPGGRPATNPPASNGIFRDGKASLYEGGVRVPAIVSWPGRLEPAVVDAPLHHVDAMPTLLALAGAKGSPTIRSTAGTRRPRSPRGSRRPTTTSRSTWRSSGAPCARAPGSS